MMIEVLFSDSWYASRLDKMVNEQRIIMVENKDPSHPYGKILRKNRTMQ